jgi:histidine kinase-like protein
MHDGTVAALREARHRRRARSAVVLLTAALTAIGPGRTVRALLPLPQHLPPGRDQLPQAREPRPTGVARLLGVRSRPLPSCARRSVPRWRKPVVSGARSSGKMFAPGDWPEVWPLLCWRRVFHGDEQQLGLLRAWLAALLPQSGAQDDVLCVATELSSNALRHTASGQGGSFAVGIACYRGVVRVLVADSGGPGEPRIIDDPAAEHGRGLLMVQSLSLRAGVLGGRRGRVVWADVPWPDFDTPGAELAVSAHPRSLIGVSWLVECSHRGGLGGCVTCQ